MPYGLGNGAPRGSNPREQAPPMSPFSSKAAESYLSGEDVSVYREALAASRGSSPLTGKRKKPKRLEMGQQGNRRNNAKEELTRLKNIASSRALVESQAGANSSNQAEADAEAEAHANSLGSYE